MTCRHCDDEFVSSPNKPGFVDECPACAVDVPRYRAEAEDEAGQSFGLIKTRAEDVRTLHFNGLRVTTRTHASRLHMREGHSLGMVPVSRRGNAATTDAIGSIPIL